MAGRVVRSDGDKPAAAGAGRSSGAGRAAGAGRTGRVAGSSASAGAESSGRSRRVAGTSVERAGAAGRRKTVFGRGSESAVGRGGEAPRKPRRMVGEAGSREPVSRSEPGQFVDARRLASEDLVARTLQENSGTLGLATRPKVVDFKARAKERRRVGARIIALRVGVAILVTALLVGLGWLLFLSPVLRLDASQVTVSGANEWVSERQVRQIVDGQTGKSLLLVDTNAMTDEMTAIAGVSRAEAVKKYPHGLAVTIKAQRPAAMLKEKGSDALTAVDAKARVLNSVSANVSVAGVPVIDVGDVDAGLKSRAVKETLTILDSLPESLRKQITKVTAKTQDSVTTELNGGEHVIVWGNSSELKLKKAVVDKILSDPNVIGDKTQVDVSAPLRPVLR
ncbi:cell division protein FtsQ/DivIB [Bifidobacterium stellenboschense]|uniref:Cell division protein FtsQ n=1 Tax=Bifidobacterium stellenboschense TaxID=762211 RepID=A0A087DQR8_9BIFI|nr:FtsQ-type POTRA domain-containing protein [Bifidobacterium stellenboschense]KFI97868.1 cell division protein FtsQ [Bifidobacterium stellenboschense]